MAKRRKRRVPGESKSAAIREYYQANPDAGPTVVAEALNAAHGWTITPGYVSTIKSKSSESGGRKKKKSKAGRKASAAGGGINESALMGAKQLADSVGLDQARAAIELLQKLS